MINYSKTIVFYDIYLKFMIPYALDPANTARLGLSSGITTELLSRQTAWGISFPNYINPATYGRLATATSNAEYKSDKSFTDSLKQTLKNNPSILLTENDYLIFDIHKNAKPRSNIPAPTAEASVFLKAAHDLNNEYRVTDVANPTSAAKPDDVKRVKVYLLVLPTTDPRPVIDKLVLEMEVGSMSFDIPFTEDQVGKIAYVAVCFSNDAGDGPLSPIIASPII